MDKKILVINAHDIDTGAGRSCLSTLQLLSKQGCQIVHVARFKGQIENHLEKIASSHNTISKSQKDTYPVPQLIEILKQ